MAGPTSPHYYLSLYDADRVRIRSWVTRAAVLGISEDLRRALTTLLNGLQIEPLTLGDPLFTYRHMGLLLCHSMRWPLRVHYAIDEQRRIVYVQQFSVVPGHPLGDRGA